MGSSRLDRVDKRFVRARQMEMEHKSHRRGSDDEIKGNTELIIYAVAHRHGIIVPVFAPYQRSLS